MLSVEEIIKNNLQKSNNFMKYFVINLNRSRERWETLLRNAPEFLKSKLQRFEAVDGSDPAALAPWQSRRAPFKTWCWCGKQLTNGELACYASHYLLWQKCIELNEPIVILEDDICFNPNFDEGIKRVQASGYDYVKLFVTSTKRIKKLDSFFHMYWGMLQEI